MKITLVSRDRYLWQKIRLLCPADEVVLAGGIRSDCDKLLWDKDSAGGDAPEGAITLSRKGDAALCVPFDEDELHRALG